MESGDDARQKRLRRWGSEVGEPDMVKGSVEIVRVYEDTGRRSRRAAGACRPAVAPRRFEGGSRLRRVDEGRRPEQRAAPVVPARNRRAFSNSPVATA